MKTSIRNIFERHGYDLRDEFWDDRAAGDIDGTLATDGVNTRTVVDTDGDAMYTSGGELIFANPNGIWGNPRIEYPAYDNTPGIVLRIDVKPQATNKQFAVGWGRVAGSYTSQYSIVFRTTSIIDTIINVASGPDIGIYDAVSEYKCIVARRETGAFMLIEGGAYATTTLLWIIDVGVGNYLPGISNDSSLTATFPLIAIPKIRWLPTPLLSDGFGSAGALVTSDGLGHAEGIAGGLGSGGGGMVYEPNTWSSDGSKASSNITLGGELVTNGNMEAGDPPNNWTGVAATLDGVADERTGGAGVQSLDIARNGADYASAYQDLVSVAGTWYIFSGWRKRIDAGVEVNFAVYDGAYTGGALLAHPGYSSSAVWVEFTLCFRAISAAFNARCFVQAIALANGVSGRFDDVSLKPIPLSDCFLAQDAGTPDVLVSGEVTVTAKTQGGVVARLDDATTPANFLLAYHDGSNVHVEKCVGGTYTSLINTAAAYSAGKAIILVTDGNSVDCYYNDAKVGTTQTVSDAGIISNTLHGSFSTYDSNTVDNLVIWKRNGYNVPA